MEIKSLRTELHGIVANRLQRTNVATKIVQGIFLIAGALLAGLAQFVDGLKSLGIFGCILVFAAGIWILLVERNVSEELMIASRAIQRTEEAMELVDEVQILEYDLNRSLNLVVGNSVIRSYLEGICYSGSMKAEDEIVAEILEISSRYITLSMGLDSGNEWTLCAYKAISDTSGKDKLQLVAHKRAIECDKGQARSWEEGVGVTGICYSMESEVIVPELQSQGIGSLFNVGRRSRPYDASRHQSIIAVPIQVDKGQRPWGVLTASSDCPEHFLPNEPGVQHAEGARALAGALALGIAIKRNLAISNTQA